MSNDIVSNTSDQTTSKRGFAAWDPEKRREAASKGGKAAHAMGTGYEWDSEAARIAGRKGAIASLAKRRAAG